MQNRTHTCNELRLANAGEKVRLSGWVENVREVGGNLAFVVLRDFYGCTPTKKGSYSHSKDLKNKNPSRYNM